MSVTGQKNKMFRRAVVTMCASLAVTFTGTTGGVATAAAPTADVYLADGAPMSGKVIRGEAEVNGQFYPRSVVQWTGDILNEGLVAEYHLGRHWRTFLATVGLRDDSPTGCVLTFEVSLDGTPAYRTELSVGQAQNATVNITDAYRMKLAISPGRGSPTFCYGAWGEARLTNS